MGKQHLKNTSKSLCWKTQVRNDRSLVALKFIFPKTEQLEPLRWSFTLKSRKGRRGIKRCHSRKRVSVPRAALTPCFLGNMLANNTSPSISAQITNLGSFHREEWIWTSNLFSKRMNLSFSIKKIIKREKKRAEKNRVWVGWRCGLCFWLHMHKHSLLLRFTQDGLLWCDNKLPQPLEA